MISGEWYTVEKVNHGHDGEMGGYHLTTGNSIRWCATLLEAFLWVCTIENMAFNQITWFNMYNKQAKK